MKKTLIALAAVAVTGTAMADVSMSGRLDFGYKGTSDTASTGVVTKTSSMGANNAATSSRLTIKGTEDIGGGLKAGFEITQQIDPTAASGTAVLHRAREVYTTVSGGFGTVKLGTFTNTLDGYVNLGFKNATGQAAGTFTGRTDTAIGYTAPKFGDVSVGIIVGSDKTTVSGADTAKENLSLVSVDYASGPLALGLTIGNVKDSITAGDKSSQTGIKASYDLGVAKVQWINTNYQDTSAAVKTGTKSNQYSVSYPMGAMTLSVGYQSNKGQDTTSTTKSNANSLSLDYALSKRTSAYVTTGSSKTKIAGVQTGKTSATAIGLIHTF